MLIVLRAPSRLLFAAGAAALATAGPAAAFAAERRPPDPCAHHGRGFQSVGPGTCVKIGGRMRVEFGVTSGGGASPWRVAPTAGAASRSALPDFAPSAISPELRVKPSRNF